MESLPLFLFALDWRGVYTRRHTYSFDTSNGEWVRYRHFMFSRPAGVTWNCLYDRETDRWEQTNLFQAAEHRRLRDQLHEQTLAWMKRFSDRGLPYARIQEAVLSPEDLELVRDKSSIRRTSGLLKGRPLDLLG